MSDLHSPGPWKIGQEYGDLMDEIECENGRTVAAVWTRTTSHTGKFVPSPCVKPDPIGHANASLISAAPDLLDACRRAFEMLDDIGIHHELTEFLTEAINKATGVKNDAYESE